MGDPWFPMYSSDWLAGTSGLTAAEKGVYITLICLMYEAEAPIPRDEGRLARRCGAPVGRFRQALSALIDEGKIVEKDGGLWNLKVQQVVDARIEKRNKARASADSRWSKKPKKNNGGGNANASAAQCERNANQNQNQNQSQKDNTPQTPQGGSEPEGFAEFWKAYPRRVGKGQARKAYAKAIKSNDPSFLIAEAEKFAKRMRGQEQRYIPHPSTWLNGERWLDEEKAPVDFLSEKERREQEEKRKKRAFYERVIAKYGDAT